MVIQKKNRGGELNETAGNQRRSCQIRVKQQYMADQLGISLPSYRKKENGDIRFSDEEKVKLAKLLELSPKQLNDYLYDGMLPLGG